MADPASLVAVAASGLAGIGLAAAVGLRGWSEWLELRRLELEGHRAPRSRSEVAELRARVRRLEAIADGSEF